MDDRLKHTVCDVAEQELRARTQPFTALFLREHTLECARYTCRIEGIRENEDTFTLFYPVRGESFFFTISIDRHTLALHGTDVANGTRCHIEMNSAENASSFIAWQTGARIGELNIRINEKKDMLEIHPAKNGIYDLEETLESLLSPLAATDTELREWHPRYGARLNVTIYQHRMRQDPISLSNAILGKIARLWLDVNIDVIPCGRPIG